MSKTITFSVKEITIPPILEHLSERVEETPREIEILNSYLIDNDVTRNELLKLLKMTCRESHRLFLVEKYMEENCPWVDLDHMESMWDYLGVNKYNSSDGRRVFFERIP